MITIEPRLIPTPGEPYVLFEVPLCWTKRDTSIVVKVTPTFFDAHGESIPFDVKPSSVDITLTNYGTVKC